MSIYSKILESMVSCFVVELKTYPCQRLVYNVNIYELVFPLWLLRISTLSSVIILQVLFNIYLSKESIVWFNSYINFAVSLMYTYLNAYCHAFVSGLDVLAVIPVT